jgi:peptidoglycan L-alanyl-D-glutamate endopeptidase CwlK
MHQYKWSDRSLQRLNGVHPELVAVITLALYAFSDDDITVNCGMRTKSEQREMVERGASQTMNSMHLVQDDGFAHAVDLIPLPVDWEDWAKFERMADAVKKAASMLNIDITWGGDWQMKDGPHFQLER